jgi:AraC-like DNA-binding protein
VDVLSDMLDTVRLESTVFAQVRLEPPWGIRAEPRNHFAFHIVPHGQGELEIDGSAPLPVAAGDVVVLAPGRGHTLRDSAGTPATDLSEMLAAGAFNREADDRGSEDQSAASTYLICGCFRFEDIRGNRLLSALPGLIHTRELSETVRPWLTQTVRLLAYESLSDRPGTSTVMKRLCDAIFVYVLRSHLATSESSWLRALVDPQIGTALGLVHEQPGAPWTVAKLAAGVGMSRSAFAERFTRVVGEAPMRYLSRWRLEKAAAALRTADADIPAIAAAAGYDSTAAFSKAFRRSIGTPPGAYHRAARAFTRGK